MKNFLLGVAVGAVGMGLYTGNIKVNVASTGETKPTYSDTPGTSSTSESTLS
jgi:hypothetical protein